MFHRIMSINWTLVFVQLIVHGFLVMAASISYSDIRTLAIRWGVYASLAWTAPLFIDGLTWMGKLGRSRRLEESTRKAGLILMSIGGSMSLVANIAVGENTGMRVYGGLVVLGYVVAEWFSGRLSGVTKRTDAAAKPAATRWQPTAAMKAAEETWRKANGYYSPKKTAKDRTAMTTKYRKRVLAEQAKQLATAGVTP